MRSGLLPVPGTLRGMHSDLPEAQYLHQNGVPEGQKIRKHLVRQSYAGVKTGLRHKNQVQDEM